MFILLLLILGVRSQDPVTNLLDSLSNRNYKGIQFDRVKPTNHKLTEEQFGILYSDSNPSETRKRKGEIAESMMNPPSHSRNELRIFGGPVLFPNDGPLPPPTPLVVTSRPLIQAIVDKINQTNSVAEQSQVDQVTFRPAYLARQKSYTPYTYAAPTEQPLYNVRQAPYDEVRNRGDGDNDYYDDKPLHPIYKAFADHAEADLKQKVKQVRYNQVPFRNPDDYQNNNNNIEDTKDYNQAENYAFSYTVKDKNTGDDFSHKQSSTGSGTNGEYRVRLPDGRMQIVSYTADENGYKADVRYDDNDKITDVNIGINNVINTNNIKNRYTTDNFDNQLYDSKSDYFYSDKSKDVHKQIPYLDNDLNNFSDRSKLNNDYLDNDNLYSGMDKNIGFRAENDDTDLNYHYVDETENNFSKEYKDYSGENNNYQPQISKFESFIDNKKAAQSTVKPSYEDIKHLFGTFKNRLNSPTPQEPVFRTRDYETTTERIVLIGGKRNNLYTNIQDSINNNRRKPYISPTPIVYTTPSSLLYSTITNLKNKISLLHKPELSNNFINKISRYLTYK